MPELNQQVLDNMDQWANLIMERVFTKESISIPSSVLAIAAIRFLRKLSLENPTLLPKSTIIKLLQNELGDIEDTAIYS